jgi:hypothetical protein
MSKQRIEWKWWGTWLIDYCCAQDAYEAYGIWEEAYLLAHPHLMDARDALTASDACDAPGTTLDLVMNHYHQSLQPFWDSWLYLVWGFLHWLPNTIGRLYQVIKYRLYWTRKRKLF